MSGIKDVFGGAAFWTKGEKLGEESTTKKVLDVLEAGGVKIIDSAAIYGQSEEILGDFEAGKRFTIDTKLKAGLGAGASTSNILADFEKSRELLKTDVDILYLHAPDYKTPLEETLAAVNEVYKSGFFKRFGLSNFKAEDVQRAYDISKEKGWVLPTVYQGNYSAVARKQETVLLPTLRKLGISFYAYSPVAGGFLTKTREQVEGGHGRFNPEGLGGGMYKTLYGKPTLLDALEEWGRIAKDEGITRAALAYRWVKYNSPLKPEHGDAIIIGASSVEQLEETLDALKKGPLSAQAVQRIDAIWEKVEAESPLDNVHG